MSTLKFPAALTAALATAIVGGLAGCSPADDAGAAGPDTAQEYFAAHNDSFTAAAQNCPDAITPSQLAADIEESSGFTPADPDAIGRRGYAGLLPETWEAFAQPEQDPNDLDDAIDVTARLACDAADRVRDNDELDVTGLDSINAPTSGPLDIRLSALTWAVVYGGEGYVNKVGGADFDDRHVGTYLQRIVPATFNA